ncbi:MAG: hypothetical protein IT221_11825 [Fluviicola sp.]|nr:hypothetical protein [Fluviicola sp.]
MKSKLILMLLSTVFLLGACSKEQRIERWMHRKDGKWSIQSRSYQYFQDGVVMDSDYATNAGSFVFDKNGSVIYNYVDVGESGSQGGTWTNTEDAISFIFNGEVVEMKISDESKKEMTLTWTEDYPSTGEKEVTVFKLARD